MKNMTGLAGVMLGLVLGVLGFVYVKTPEGWRIKSRTHVRNKAWHSPLLQTPDLN